MRSIFDEADDLEAGADELAGVPAFVKPVSPVHLAAVDLLDKIFGLSEQLAPAGGVPAAARVAIATMRSMKPLMIEGISHAPEELVRAFMTDLRDELTVVVEAGTTPRPEGIADDPGTAGAEPPALAAVTT